MARRAVDEAASPLAGAACTARGSCCGTATRCSRHTFRGVSWRSLLGLESERDVFARYKDIRRMERRYLWKSRLPLTVKSRMAVEVTARTQRRSLVVSFSAHRGLRDHRGEFRRVIRQLITMLLSAKAHTSGLSRRFSPRRAGRPRRRRITSTTNGPTRRASRRAPAACSAPRLQNLGAHTFKVTTRSSRAQQFINQGLNLAYGFNHAEAGRAFAEAARLDPACAMAYWGQALVLGPEHQRGDGARRRAEGAGARAEGRVARARRDAARARLHRRAREALYRQGGRPVRRATGRLPRRCAR